MKKYEEMYQENEKDNIIDLKDVYKNFRNKGQDVEILKGLTFSVKKGSFLVVVGKSGSGKTTLMNVMSGMTKASKGDVIVANCNLSNHSNSQLISFRRNNVSFIFQEYGLLSTLSAMDNINSGTCLSKDKLPKSKVDEIIKFLDLQDHVKKMPSELSGGQQQRISIARALVKNPKIIFGDEPTGSLDSYTSYRVLMTLKEINKLGTTLVLVTHDSRVAKLADHIIEIGDGKIIKNYKNKPLKDFKDLFI
ncbi:MAG: ABC transporter ATP-binding protein [Mycoplasmoidaceae bacterium]